MLHNPEVEFRAMSAPVRAIGNVYQNQSSRPLLVILRIGINATGIADIFLDTVTPPVDQVGRVNGSAMGQTVSFIVPPGYYYKVTETAATVAIGDWHEIQ